MDEREYLKVLPIAGAWLVAYHGKQVSFAVLQHARMFAISIAKERSAPGSILVFNENGDVSEEISF